jgi:hypothetical protein
VGRPARGSVDKEVLGDKKQVLSVEQKIDRELSFVVESLDLDEA